MWKAKVEVVLKAGVLDPQGKAVQGGLATLGFAGLQEVRVGKLIELRFEANSRETARGLVEEACRRLLANPVIEEYRFSLEEAC
ncbi:MAG: phosphoribosylformylglycinamidine synthase subunit PurS [Betaproteobacteria bacterium]